MKKYLILILLLFCFSCNSEKYFFDNKVQTIGVDFSNGKWLLNEIEVPSNIANKITELAINDFGENLGNRLSYAPNTKGLLLPQKQIRLNPEKSVLSNLYEGTQYDYFINLKAVITRNDLSSIDYTNHKFKNGYRYKTSEVVIEIYDLKNSNIIYSQKVIASVKQKIDNNDISFSKNQYLLILGAYKRLMKDINKRSSH